jgi:NADP-dependent 3-hydroxy acid dehydrogenase YdfG
VTTQLADSVVLVTGATGQVGWGVAQAADEAGATLILTARSTQSEAALKSTFPSATILLADVGTATGIASVAHAVSEKDGLDHVVAPIGAWWQGGNTLDQEPDELDQPMNTFVGAQFRLLRAVAPFLQRSGGSYTLVTGAGGERYLPGSGLLLVALRGQFALAEVMRTELRDDRMRFNEFRIEGRVEREERDGVIPSLVAGRAFVDVMAGGRRSELIRFPEG